MGVAPVIQRAVRGPVSCGAGLDLRKTPGIFCILLGKMDEHGGFYSGKMR